MTDTDNHREIRSKRIAAGEAQSVVIRRTYDAAIEDVWDACTDPKRLNRWFLEVSGDLRVGGRFQLKDNAGGEILRCDPPRLLAVSWVYGDVPAGEVQLRLSPGDGGYTVLELEHATAAREVELDGRRVDAFLNDPQTGMWGIGVGWEMPLTYGLTKYLRGELPDAPAAEWYELTPEDIALADRLGQEWAAVVAAAPLRPGTGPAPAPSLKPERSRDA